MTDPTINTGNAASTQRPATYGGKTVGKGKALRKLTSKTRKQTAKRMGTGY